jgi:rod shape-determining protein MreC
MQKLIEFLIAKKHWLMFFVCEIIAFTLIYRNNAYQRNMIMMSANVVTGRILSVSNAVFSYLDLQKVNRLLVEKNNRLEMELVMLREQLNEKTEDTISAMKEFDYAYITAGVVNNSTIYTHNYITLNKGSDDGIHSDMGVVSMNGLAGVVMTVNASYSLVISLLNTNLKISAKVKDTHYFGTLSWKGGDPRFAFLEELPAHAVFNAGDTIVTSGYSTFFPQGIMVGIVDSYNRQHDDNFFLLKVRLSTDFQTLRTVSVIENRNQEAQREIEKGIKKNE